MKVALTTGEVSKICNVSQKTVIKWFDDGLLEGYKIPGTKDRRVPIKSLNEFIQKNNIPISVLSTNFIEFYWDFFHQNKEECKDCIVSKNRARVKRSRGERPLRRNRSNKISPSCMETSE